MADILALSLDAQGLERLIEVFPNPNRFDVTIYPHDKHEVQTVLNISPQVQLTNHVGTPALTYSYNCSSNEAFLSVYREIGKKPGLRISMIDWVTEKGIWMLYDADKNLLEVRARSHSAFPEGWEQPKTEDVLSYFRKILQAFEGTRYDITIKIAGPQA